MRVLVVGGSGSGKSAYAEQLACSLSPRRTYVATMESQSAEAQRRIARHRAQRDGLGFITIECSRALPVGDWPKHPRFQSAKWPKHPRLQSAKWPKNPRFQSATPTGVALVEDLGNLVANALFAPDGSMGDPSAVVEDLARNVLDFSRTYEHVVVVGNLVGCEGASVYEATREWVRAVGTLCCRL
ncbi:MAG: bifunctional adenosylcobinamide kinase/adenosylcobinamide-phosphate guanylyltransferase, partial [Atopobiaceae bacterium]|nr:bifunctional adenosylcobinamide kinase/adenosylcobinamide-phosphate guanylyltransferase [Atopobiaceae bacterium]